MDLHQAREWVADPAGMDAAAAQAFLDLLLSGSLAVEEGGALLADLARRGEHPVEIAAFVRGLMDRAVTVPLPRPAMDVCGTGGSGLTRFNVSTCVAFVAAAAGVPIAKHGNRGSRRANGSCDVLEALGAAIDPGPERLVRCFEETGCCFIFARSHHPAMAAAVPYRQAAGCRTIFNLAGPLSNPAPLAARMIGTIAVESATVIIETLALLGDERALVVRGEPGIDEASVTGMSDWLRFDRGHRSAGRIDDPPHPALAYEDLPGGDAEDNAVTFLRILRGEERGPLLSMVLLNAGLAIDTWHGRPPVLRGEGWAAAEAALERGAALACFERYRALSHSS